MTTDRPRRQKTAVLVSGRGSNLQALIDAAMAPDYPAEISLVISNVPGAGALARAEMAAIPTRTIDHRPFGKGADARAAFDAALDQVLRDADIDIVCLAGFLRLFGPAFPAAWRGRLINIHPSLLPAYKGLHVHQRMIADGIKIAGCTVHHVVADMDAGPIIGQAAVSVYPDDDSHTLSARILAEEHQLYPACLRLVAGGGAVLDNAGVVRLQKENIGSGAFHNPARPAPDDG